MERKKRISLKSKSKSPEKYENEFLQCEVILLDPTQQNFKVNVDVTEEANILFNKVCEVLGGILEKDYFGLKFIDRHGQQQWLDLNKSTYKQVKDKFNKKSSQLFSFRFKHYPRNPHKDLQQDLSKYLLYLQLRRDLYRGRLVGSPSDQYRLAALILQAEIGGFNRFEIEAVKISDLKILPYINRKAEAKIMTIYESYKHLDSQEAERVFLEEASMLETYGVEPLAVKDQKGNDLFVGITYEGVSTFNGSKKVHTFPWHNIIKLSFSHKLFMFQVIMDQKKHILGFKCDTTHAACALWKSALDRKFFFTLDKASEARHSRSGGSLFRRKKSHIFAGRSQMELTRSCQTLEIIPQPHVVRAQSMMTLIKSNNSRSESTHVNEITSQNDFQGYATLPRSQGRKSYLSDSSDDGEMSKNNNTRNKPTSAAVGAVLDFMQALKETPVSRRKSFKDSLDNMNPDNVEHSSQESQKLNDDEDNKIVTDIIEIEERQRNSLKPNALLNDEDSRQKYYYENVMRDSTSPQWGIIDRNQHSMASYVIVSLVLIFFCILFGLLTLYCVHITDSSLFGSVNGLPIIYSEG